MYAKSALLLAAAAATASALTAAQDEQLNIIFADVGAHLSEYISLVSNPSSGITMSNLPAGLIDIGEKVAVDPSDTSYTSEYTEVDMAGVSAFVTKLPWYSSRIAPKLDAAGVPIGGETTTTTSSSSSAAEKTTTSSSAAATSSAAAEKTTSSSSAAETTSSAAAEKTTSSSSAAEATSSAAAEKTTSSSAAAATTSSADVKATTQAVSQIGDGQIQATVAVSQQTENGAAKAVAGLGAGAIAAAALLL